MAEDLTTKLCVRTVNMTLDTLHHRTTSSSSTDLCSILDELDEQVVAGGPLMAAVQTVGVTIHCYPPRLQQHSIIPQLRIC